MDWDFFAKGAKCAFVWFSLDTFSNFVPRFQHGLFKGSFWKLNLSLNGRLHKGLRNIFNVHLKHNDRKKSISLLPQSVSSKKSSRASMMMKRLPMFVKPQKVVYELVDLNSPVEQNVNSHPVIWYVFPQRWFIIKN